MKMIQISLKVMSTRVEVRFMVEVVRHSEPPARNGRNRNFASAPCHPRNSTGNASSFYGRTSSQQPENINGNSPFYDETPPNDRSPPVASTWQRGEYIPINNPSVSQVDIQSLLVQMQSSITSEIKKIQGSTSSLTNRVLHLEETIAENVRVSSVSSTPRSSESSGGSGSGRKRCLPVALSVSNVYTLFGKY